MIDLTIKTLDSQNHKFKVPDTFTILELKEHIAEQVNVTVVQQRLIFCGRVLSNETKLSDIGIDGKVMHLVQKVPRLTTTTSGISSSTTTNTNSRSAQNGGSGFRGWHAHDPTVLFGAIGIPSELMHAGELPRVINARNHGTGNRISLAIDMIRKGNEILHRLENPRTIGGSSTSNTDQLSEEQQHTEETTGNPPESSVPPTQTDPDSVNVSYEVDETFPNTVVVTIDATHHMRMPPVLMRHMHNHFQANNTSTSNQNSSEQTIDGLSIPEFLALGTVGPTTDHMVEQLARELSPIIPLSPINEQNLRNDRQNPENRASLAIADRRRLKELIEQLNKLQSRLQPFYTRYCQFINDDPHFESPEGESGSLRAQAVFNGVSEVMHYISHVYHAISDLRVAFSRPPPRSFQSRPCLLQGTILQTAHSVTTTTSGTPPSTQQPTSTQTTTTSQSIPSVRAFRLDFMNQEGAGSESSNVSTSTSRTETNTNVTVDPNTESNNTSTQFPSETPHGVELMFDLTPGSIRIDSVEAAFVTPNASGSNQPTTVSQPSTGSETSNNMSMPVDWMDQMIDVISSGVRRPLMSIEQSLDWGSIPTTSTHTPRVTPRTTNSSTGNSPAQGLSRGRWDTTPRMDPFLPCSSHHFESNLRPVVLARRPTQGMERSTSSTTSGNSTTDTSTPTSPIEVRAFSARRSSRPRARFIQESDGFPLTAGIHPVLTWGRNRNNVAATSGSNNAQGSGLSDIIAGQMRNLESVLDNTVYGELNLDLRREIMNIQPSRGSRALEPTINTNPQTTARQSEELLRTPLGNIPYFRDMEGQFVLLDLLLLIARNWTLYDILNLNTDLESSIEQNPISRQSEAIVNFIFNRVMRNQSRSNHSIEEAAHRLHLEMMRYINVFQCSLPTRHNIDINASFRQCIVHNLHQLVVYCEQSLGRVSNDIMSTLTGFAEALLSLVFYCCNSRAVFRLSIGSLLRFLPLPDNLQNVIADQVRLNIDKYWNVITSLQITRLQSAVDFIVPYSNETESGQTSRIDNEEQPSNPSLPSSEISNEPEVVIGSQEWHQSVPSEWVPVITRDSQRQRRQGAQPPYSDAYLSGMPSKRRKIVTSSKPQGPLSQIIAKNLEVAMSAAGVTINKEVTAVVGADTAVQNAYSERIRSSGRFGLDTNPDFCHVRYPNASKFFYERARPN